MSKRGGGPVAALVAMVLIWGYSWILMKIALRYAHPVDFSALRVAIGGALLFAIAAFQRRPLRLRSYRMAIVIGSLQVALFVALSQLALLAAGPGKTSVLVFTMPFWMVIFAHRILHERMNESQWLAVALAFAGLVLIVAPWNLTHAGASLLAVAAGAVWAIASVISKKWPSREDQLTFTAWQLAVGTAWLTALSFAVPHAPVQWNAEFIGALLFCALLATGIGWWLWTYVLANMSAGVAGLNSLGIPVVAVLASAIQLGERPPPLELAGMLMIGAALVLLARLGMMRRAPKAMPAPSSD